MFYNITLGGWPAFSQLVACVDKKEQFETFDWLPIHEINLYGKSEREYFEDCREALDRVEGSREWLKAYEGSFTSESGDIYWKIVDQMMKDHSGFSGPATLWSYKMLLNDWDGWVFKQKKRRALALYKKQQVPSNNLKYLISCCKEYNDTKDADLEHEIKYKCACLCISGCITELRGILEYALDEAEGPPLEDIPPASSILMPFLPLGSHLLPLVFQEHLKKWNIEMTRKMGDWVGVERKQYRKLYPESWAEFHAENRRLTELYAEEVAAVKAYQAEHVEDSAVLEESETGNDNSIQPD